MMIDHLTQAKEAQDRIDGLRARGADPRSTEVRGAVNRLMAQLRKLTAEERAAFDAWKAKRTCDP